MWFGVSTRIRDTTVALEVRGVVDLDGPSCEEGVRGSSPGACAPGLRFGCARAQEDDRHLRYPLPSSLRQMRTNGNATLSSAW